MCVDDVNHGEVRSLALAQEFVNFPGRVDDSRFLGHWIAYYVREVLHRADRNLFEDHGLALGFLANFNRLRSRLFAI